MVEAEAKEVISEVGKEAILMGITEENSGDGDITEVAMMIQSLEEEVKDEDEDIIEVATMTFSDSLL